MRLLNIAKCRFVVTDINEKRVEVKAGDVVDVADAEANKLLKIYPNAWKNLDINIPKPVEKKEAKEEKKEEASIAEEAKEEVEVESGVKKTSRKKK